MKGHYEDSGIDKKTMHAMKARKLASDVSLVFDFLYRFVQVYVPNRLTVSILFPFNWQKMHIYDQYYIYYVIYGPIFY